MTIMLPKIIKIGTPYSAALQAYAQANKFLRL